jgi:type 1 glutamine amidotransferase
MKKIFSFLLFTLIQLISISAAGPSSEPIRLLVVTGGHDYNKEQFNLMLSSLGSEITFQVVEFPAAFDMFLPENRTKYDVLIFYHMWQEITDEQAVNLSECIKEGKPLIALHHSLCAFDDWPEYINIIGGKYFHKTTVVNGISYAPCTYKHDLNFKVYIMNPKNPVTKGIQDFMVFDETYKGYYVEEGVTHILAADESSSMPYIGWTKKYGKARVVTIQSGHDSPTFGNPNFRKLLKQAIEWVYQ